jgi:hypothetical protein
MTARKSPAKNGVYCPHCRARIKGLYYLSHQSITGEFTLARGHEDNLGADQDGIEYCCPHCDRGLFKDKAQAEAFLLGRSPSPMRSKQRAVKKINALAQNCALEKT